MKCAYFFWICCSCQLHFSLSWPAEVDFASTVAGYRAPLKESLAIADPTTDGVERSKPGVISDHNTDLQWDEAAENLEGSSPMASIGILENELDSLLGKYLTEINELCQGGPPTGCDCAYGIRNRISHPIETDDLKECRPGICTCDHGAGVIIEVAAPGLELGGVHGYYHHPMEEKFKSVDRACEGFGNCECFHQRGRRERGLLRLQGEEPEEPALTVELMDIYLEAVNSVCGEHGWLKACECGAMRPKGEISFPITHSNFFGCEPLGLCHCRDGNTTQAPEIDIAQLQAAYFAKAKRDQEEEFAFEQSIPEFDVQALYFEALDNLCEKNNSLQSCSCHTFSPRLEIFVPIDLDSFVECEPLGTCVCLDGSIHDAPVFDINLLEDEQARRESEMYQSLGGSFLSISPSLSEQFPQPEPKDDLDVLDLYLESVKKLCSEDNPLKLCTCSPLSIDPEIHAPIGREAFLGCEPLKSCQCQDGLSYDAPVFDANHLQEELPVNGWMKTVEEPVNQALTTESDVLDIYLKRVEDLCTDASPLYSCTCTEFSDFEVTFAPLTIQGYLNCQSFVTCTCMDGYSAPAPVFNIYDLEEEVAGRHHQSGFLSGELNYAQSSPSSIPSQIIDHYIHNINSLCGNSEVRFCECGGQSFHREIIFPLNREDFSQCDPITSCTCQDGSKVPVPDFDRDRVQGELGVHERQEEPVTYMPPHAKGFFEHYTEELAHMCPGKTSPDNCTCQTHHGLIGVPFQADQVLDCLPDTCQCPDGSTGSPVKLSLATVASLKDQSSPVSKLFPVALMYYQMLLNVIFADRSPCRADIKYCTRASGHTVAGPIQVEDLLTCHSNRLNNCTCPDGTEFELDDSYTHPEAIHYMLSSDRFSRVIPEALFQLIAGHKIRAHLETYCRGSESPVSCSCDGRSSTLGVIRAPFQPAELARCNPSLCQCEVRVRY